MTGNPTPEIKEGIVAILDALGSSTLSSSEAQTFIKRRQNFLDVLGSASFRFEWLEDTLRYQLKRLPLFTFGDTIVFGWEVPPNTTDTYQYMPVVLEYLVRVITVGFQTGIMWRGCISYGQFCADTDSNTIIGPAVADAAQWYDKAKWSGIIASPFCGKAVSRSALALGGRRNYEPIFCEYEVPLKTAFGETYKEKMWVVSWPIFYEMQKDARGAFYKDIQQFPVPKDTEHIFYATRDFLNWYLDRNHPKHDDLRPQVS